MGGTDRPAGAEHPEQTDRPPSVAERTDRYEARIDEYYSRPENHDKLDPFERLSPEQIERLYRPDSDDPLRSRVVFEGGVPRLIDPARERPERTDRPDWHEEPETARRIRADHGDRDAGDREPIGDELIEPENEKTSLREQLRKEALRRSDSLHDAVQEAAGHVDGLVESIKPTGTETRPPPPIPYATERRHDVDAGDPVGAWFAAMVACYAVIDMARRRVSRSSREEVADAGH